MFKRIRAAKTWQERAALAQDELPGTAFDFLFAEARLAMQLVEWKSPLEAHHCLMKLGAWLANIISKGDVSTLRKAAIALNDWKCHKPKPNYDLEVLFSMSGMFPPGWTKTVANFDEVGQIIRDPRTGRPILGAKPGTRDKIAMRDIKQNLAEIDPKFDEDKWESRRRKIQRYANEFGILLDEAAGRPRRKLRQYSRKKLR